MGDWAGIVGSVAGVLSLVIAVVAWLTPSTRDVAEDLKEDPEYRGIIAARLRGATVGTVYRDLLAGGLTFLDRHMGPPNSARALRVSMLLPILYAWATFALPWGLGAPGSVGGFALLDDAAQPGRAVAAVGLVLWPFLQFRLGTALGRRAGRAERRGKLWLWFRLRRKDPWITRRRFEVVYRLLSALVCVAAIAAFDRLDNMILIFAALPMLGSKVGAWTAVRLRSNLLAMMAAAGAGVIIAATISVGAGVLGVALAVALDGVAILALAGTGMVTAFFAVTMAAVAAGSEDLGRAATPSAIGVAVAGASAAAIAAGSRSAMRGTLLGAFAALIGLGSAAALEGKGLADEFAAAILLFFFVLPIVNGVWDWLSWIVTRRLGAQLLRRTTVGAHNPFAMILRHGLLDLAAAVALMLSMAFALALGFEVYNEVAVWQRGRTVFALEPFIQTAAADPWLTGFWLTAMLGTTLAPTFLHGVILILSPLALAFLPDRRRLELVIGLEGYDDLPDEGRKAAVRRRAAWWLTRARVGSWTAAILLFLAVLALLLGAIRLLHQGGFADWVRDAAHAGIWCARWLGSAVLGNTG